MLRVGRDRKVCNKSRRVLIYLWGTASDFISSYRCRWSMCLLLGIPRALAMVSVSKDGSRAIKAPWIPWPWRLSANSWGAQHMAAEKMTSDFNYSPAKSNLIQKSNVIAIKGKPQPWASLKKKIKQISLSKYSITHCESRKNTCMLF